MLKITLINNSGHVYESIIDDTGQELKYRIKSPLAAYLNLDLGWITSGIKVIVQGYNCYTPDGDPVSPSASLEGLIRAARDKHYHDGWHPSPKYKRHVLTNDGEWGDHDIVLVVYRDTMEELVNMAIYEPCHETSCEIL